MARRPTIEDVSHAAGVSPATVDRVLNGRQKVREETARRVYEAAQKLGYHGVGLIAQRMRAELPYIRFGIVLHKERQEFYKAFRTELEKAALNLTSVRADLKIRFSPSQNPADFVNEMAGLAQEVDALAATAITDNAISEEVERLQALGIPCFSVLNDFAAGIRQSYLGLNNLKVGRIAASIIALSVDKPGKVAVFVGGHRWHGHELRETGFRSFLREKAPRFQTLETLVNLETRQLTYEATLDLLHRHPDLRGIYCAGGGMEGAIAALREVREPGEVALVVNELTSDSRKALADGYVVLVIGTPLATLCRVLLETMTKTVVEGMSQTSAQHFLQPDLYLPECI